MLPQPLSMRWKSPGLDLVVGVPQVFHRCSTAVQRMSDNAGLASSAVGRVAMHGLEVKGTLSSGTFPLFISLELCIYIYIYIPDKKLCNM